MRMLLLACYTALATVLAAQETAVAELVAKTILKQHMASTERVDRDYFLAHLWSTGIMRIRAESLCEATAQVPHGPQVLPSCDKWMSESAMHEAAAELTDILLQQHTLAMHSRSVAMERGLLGDVGACPSAWFTHWQQASGMWDRLRAEYPEHMAILLMIVKRSVGLYMASAGGSNPFAAGTGKGSPAVHLSASVHANCSAGHSYGDRQAGVSGSMGLSLGIASGRLGLLDPRGPNTPFDADAVGFALSGGELLLFPSYMQREVLPTAGDGEYRVSVEFNVPLEERYYADRVMRRHVWTKVQAGTGSRQTGATNEAILAPTLCSDAKCPPLLYYLALLSQSAPDEIGPASRPHFLPQ